jgi:transcriptional regulator with AAA-type ATPase domain
MLAAPGTVDLPGVDTLAIKLFSLPQRKADIPDFARYFLSRFCQEQNRAILTLDQVDFAPPD